MWYYTIQFILKGWVIHERQNRICGRDIKAISDQSVVRWKTWQATSEVWEKPGIQIPSSGTTWPLKMKVTYLFEPQANTYPATQHHISEDQSSWTHCYENSQVTVTYTKHNISARTFPVLFVFSLLGFSAYLRSYISEKFSSSPAGKLRYSCGLSVDIPWQYIKTLIPIICSVYSLSSLTCNFCWTSRHEVKWPGINSYRTFILIKCHYIAPTICNACSNS